MPPGDDKDNDWERIHSDELLGLAKSKDSCAAALKQQNAVTIELSETISAGVEGVNFPPFPVRWPRT